MSDESTPLASSEIPEWRTSTVINLCEQMRLMQDFSALPILADALQEENFSDEAQLTLLRSGSMSTIQAQRMVCLLMGGEYEQAVRKVEEIAEALGDHHSNSQYYPDQDVRMDYEFIMQVAADFDATSDKWGGDTFVQYGSEWWRDNFPPEVFWDSYSLITGQYAKVRGTIFGCSC